MFLDSRLKLGSKYSLGEMAVGLVGLAACCTGAWDSPTTRLSVQGSACLALPSSPLPVAPTPLGLAHPAVGGMLLSHPEEGLEWSLPS